MVDCGLMGSVSHFRCAAFPDCLLTYVRISLLAPGLVAWTTEDEKHALRQKCQL